MLVLTGLLILLLHVLLWEAKTTYIIRDGSRTLIRTTAQTDPAEILEEAGIELSPGDKAEISKTKDGPVLQVLRRQKITVDYFGEPMEVISYGETVADLLRRLELTVGEGDEMSHRMETQTCDSMTLRIYRSCRMEQTYTVTLPLEILYCCDPTLPAGIHQVLTQGRSGELLRTALVTYVNEQEVHREVLSEEVLIPPVVGIVAIGTGRLVEEPEPAVPVIGNGMISLPTGEVLTYSGVISSLATAYCAKGLTATGTEARVGAIAVDPKYIPYGTRMFILSKDGAYIYGIATAEDCGSEEHIYGTRIDLYYNTEEECVQFGARMCWVYILC